MKRYIITETGKYSSLDPLDADQTPNLPVARMIYATPLEISENNELSSLVLESFKISKNGKSIYFVVKKGLKFSDETPIQSEDVEFAILRMALSRPQFPVIDHIVGLDRWIKKAHPLNSKPSGIKISGQKISISFTKKMLNPLFRFSLELFSIIPKKSVDLLTGKIQVKEIPSSGLFKIIKQDSTSVVFKRTDLANKIINIPENIKFEYWPANSLPERLSTITNNDIVAGNESMYSFQQMEEIAKQKKVSFLPAARFADLDLNPTSEFFKEKICRQIFADTFRKSFAKVADKYTLVEASIFTRIIPGFMSIETLREKTFSKISNSQLNYCQIQLAKKPFQWGYVRSEKNTAFLEALTMTLKKLGYQGKKPLVAESRKELNTWFTEGKIAVTNGGSGFWAQDPIGDLQMLFTPNLHKSLDYVTQDKTLQKKIRKIRDNPSNKTLLFEMNQYIHDEALFNVYSYVRRFYISTYENQSLDLPFAITAPPPWQVFVR